MEIKCCECEHFKRDIVKMGRETHFKPSKCWHDKCFKDVTHKDPVYGTVTRHERVSNYEILNENNDCPYFEMRK